VRLDHAPFLIGQIALVSGRSAAMLFASDCSQVRPRYDCH
jgi:hypothetical protein